MAFGEKLSPTAAIASILSAYPFSVGLLREILQNSDDAKASKQTFVLDRRSHPKDSIHHELADAQGPALLACNDALFTKEDWEAVQTIYESSKTTDTSKIGKYGVGFRSCYHVTDNPQILSGSELAIFDPHHAFTSSGGETFNFVERAIECVDHLSGFNFFIPVSARTVPFPQTIIRLPLRTTAGAAKSLIKKAAVGPCKIRQLFDDFIEEEIGIVLLFLTHVSSIEIYEVDDQGTKLLASAELKRAPDADRNVTSYRCSTNVTTATSSLARSWRVFQASYSDSEAAKLISDRLGYDIGLSLQQHKLTPKVGIAMPISPHSSPVPVGRLYTYLPLPLTTGFPCHIHGLFALTPDRQHLRNGEETGVVNGIDSVLVAWNRLMFDTFIPSAWAALLPILLTQDNLVSIFEAWPPSRTPVSGGDTMYWNDLPRKVLSAITRDKLEVWPVITSGSPGLVNPKFADLGSLLVASEADGHETLTAFALAGVSITRPPSWVMSLLKDAKVDFVLLTPLTARQALLNNVSLLAALHSKSAEVDRILTYLLSTMDLMLIAGLPLIQVVDGAYIALEKRSDDGPTHVLLTKNDMEVFCGCDEKAIDVTQLPVDIAELFVHQASTILNVNLLTREQVIKYIQTSFNRFNLSLESSSTVTVEDPVIDWLSSFWKWLGAWTPRNELFPFIHAFSLVPTSRNTLLPSGHGVFDPTHHLDIEVLDALESVGILFLHQKAYSVRQPLEEQGVIKSVLYGHHILDHISMDQVNITKTKALDAIRRHLLSLANSRSLGPLDQRQQHKLRCLPIFPVLFPAIARTSNSYAIRELKPIADDQTIVFVVGISLIPIVHNTVFVDDCQVLLDYLPGAGSVLDAVGVLSLIVDHMAQQPKHIHRAFLEYIVKTRDELTAGQLRRLLENLSKAPFVSAYSSILQAPQDLFDPECPVAAILPHDSRCPRYSNDDDMAIVTALRSLGLFRNTLANDVIDERIAHISRYSSAQESIDLAKRLIQLIVDLNYDCSRLDIDPALKWLPTREGLLGSQECHHRDAHPVGLFDEVLPIVVVNNLSTSLVTALGWDELIPLSVVKRQLAKVVQHGQGHKKLELLIQELGKRVNSSQDKDTLCHIISDRPWIPISPRCIVSTSHAVLSSETNIPPGFYVVPPRLADDPCVRQFLELMGCGERPASNTLLEDLDNLRRRESDADTIKVSLRLLDALAHMHLTDEEKAKLLVPESHGHLLPVAQVYFNDLDPHQDLKSLPHNASVAHQNLSFELAKRLGMNFIGHSGLKSLLITDCDMGEALTSRIESVLAQYSVEQAFSEFLANAADAKATTFGIMLDERPAATSRVLSPALVEIQVHPSLIVYNNSVFETKDFDGILNVGRGGKIGESDTIGQFGLGALSMFHFTDVAMIISGDRIMFLDPSKQYLPFTNRYSASMTIHDIKGQYSGHLVPLCGLYGFSLDLDYYPGTIFRLPLRTGKSPLTPNYLTAHEVRSLIEGHYLKIAPQTLLFTRINTINAEHRDVQDRRSQYWSVEGNRTRISHHNTCEEKLCIRTSADSEVDGEWVVLFGESHLPSKFQPLVVKHRLRKAIRVGLAAHLTSRGLDHQLFATMPLPISTGNLPIHLSAPFILSHDRRSIRRDGEEEKYNSWLLSHLVPPLYFHLLEHLVRTANRTDSAWWRWWPYSTDDMIARTLIDSFYSGCIAKTDRHICVTVAGNTISPREAIFLGTKNAEAKLLLYLQPPNLVQLRPDFRSLLEKQIKMVDPGFVKQVILQNVHRVRAAFIDGQMTVRDIQDIVSFLVKDDRNGENIVGLPLLPLASGTLTDFGRSADTMHYTVRWFGKAEIPTVFPLDRFVDHRFNITGIDQGLNVSKFDGFAVQDLIQDRIPSVSQRDDTPTEDRSWIKRFWSEFHLMMLEPETISKFPLISTTTPDSYISLQECDTDAVVIMNQSTSEQDLATILARLGAIIVPYNRCHYSLRKVLDKYPPFSIDIALRFLKTAEFSMMKRFSGLSAPQHRRFAQWGRDNVLHTSTDLFSIACKLPIWPALGGGEDGPFLSASDITMMPAVVLDHSLDALRFLRMGPNFVQYSTILHQKFKKEPMSIARFRDSLNVTQGKILISSDIRPYKRLLEIIIRNCGSDRGSVLVPNGNEVLDYTHNLYARSQNLFCEAFHTRKERLVHESFKNLEQGLQPFGLRTEMNFASFKECIEVIHEDVKIIREDVDGDRMMDRAALLFEWYCTRLPALIGCGSPRWRELDSFRFIPPAIGRGIVSYDRTRYIPPPLGDQKLVSPEEVLRAEHRGIAWTQRALFSPSGNLLVADLSLGVPDPVQVLNHLRILALQLAPLYPFNRELLTDIRQTYQWLEKHKEDSNLRKSLVQYHAQPLFLNVDDPAQLDWTWRSADQLYFNISDVPISNCWRVATFLLPFKGLLRLAGVDEVQMPTAPEVHVSTVEERLDRSNVIRNAYNDMRRKAELTDVIFTTDDGGEFPAHRVVLAGAGVEHFRDLFLGQWGESNVMVDKPIAVPGYPKECLDSILEYLYTGVLPIIEEQAILLDVLHLAHRWEISALVEEMQNQLVAHISLDTYDSLRDEAQVLDARLLADKCDEFERQNQAAIRRFTEFDIDSRPS